jgi:hypothetical protein
MPKSSWGALTVFALDVESIPFPMLEGPMGKTPIRITIAQLRRRLNNARLKQSVLSNVCPESRDAIRAQAKADALYAVYCAIMGQPDLLEDLGGTDG